MQPLLVLFIGALLGVAYGDLSCYEAKVKVCSTKILESTDKYGFCDLQPKMISCYKSAASECGSSFLHQIEVLEGLYTQMCQEGSYLNKEMKKHQECLVAHVLADLSCYKGIIDFSKVEPTPESMLEVQKKTCQNLDQIQNCMLDLSRTSCGNDAEQFVRKIFLPSMEMQRGICQYILSSSSPKSLEYPVFYGPLDFTLKF